MDAMLPVPRATFQQYNLYPECALLHLIPPLDFTTSCSRPRGEPARRVRHCAAHRPTSGVSGSADARGWGRVDHVGAAQVHY
eukprot:523124-Rhodomonas_salina.2